MACEWSLLEDRVTQPDWLQTSCQIVPMLLSFQLNKLTQIESSLLCIHFCRNLSLSAVICVIHHAGRSWVAAPTCHLATVQACKALWACSYRAGSGEVQAVKT